MIRGFGFFFYHSLKNQVKCHLRRLRRPKYFLSGIVGLLYFYLVFFRQLFSGRGRADWIAAPDLELLRTAEIGFAAVLLALTLAPWLSPSRGSGVVFSEAEIQFLFPAPLARRDLLHLRMCRVQIPILFSVLLTALIFGRSPAVSHPAFLVATLWIVYSFLSLYRMAAFMAKLSLAEHGRSALRRRTGFLSLLGGVALFIAIWLYAYVPAPPAPIGFRSLLRWFSEVADSGPAFYLLLPFRALVRPAFASGGLEFAGRLGPALFLLYWTYRWVIRSDVGFQEASLEESEKAARRIAESRRSGRKQAVAPRAESRRPPFFLRSRGMPHVAFFWKNLISAGRFGPGRLRVMLLIALALVAFGRFFPYPEGRQMVAQIVGSAAAGLALILTFVGPLVVRDDLRSDLLHVEELRTYPVPGWGIVLGEVLAPAGVIAVQQWMLLFLAICLFPEGGRWSMGTGVRVAVGIGAGILLPSLSLLGVIAHNAAALFMPGWVHLGKDEQQGIEATGQRLISLVAVTAVLGAAAIPAGIAFVLVFIPGRWMIGLGAIPIAALGAALALAIEAGICIAWLGRVFERLDPSQELLGARS